MNEPTNPSDPPPSKSSPPPPPPPPPPFTPPPESQTPPSMPAPPKPPIYTPPPGQPPKKSALPWVLGGCGCLTLIVIVIAIVAMVTYRVQRKAAEFKSDFKSALKEVDQTSRALTNPDSTTGPKAGWQTYVNTKAKLPSSLEPNFIAFSFDYPRSFEIQPQSDVNFVKVEKSASAGKGNTAENFAVGYARFNDRSAQSDALYNALLDQLGQQLAAGFHNYKELKRMSEAVDGVNSRAALFQADFNDAAKTMIYGKTIVVHPPGKMNGVTILILGTSLSRDIKRPDDLGTVGDTADILRSFKFL